MNIDYAADEMNVLVLELEKIDGRRGLRELTEDAVNLALFETFLPVTPEVSFHAITSLGAMELCSSMPVHTAIERLRPEAEGTSRPSMIVFVISTCADDDEWDIDEGDVDRDVNCCEEGDSNDGAEVEEAAGAGAICLKVGIRKRTRCPAQDFPASCAFSRSTAGAVVR